MNVEPSTWEFKCKRYPDGSVQKLKALLCVRGDKQVEGVDYFYTYDPVVIWTIVQIMLILLSIIDLATTQVDYTAAFVRDDGGEDVYIEMPKSLEIPASYSNCANPSTNSSSPLKTSSINCEASSTTSDLLALLQTLASLFLTRS
jgi:hypothetical protein